MASLRKRMSSLTAGMTTTDYDRIIFFGMGKHWYTSSTTYKEISLGQTESTSYYRLCRNIPVSPPVLLDK